MKSQRIKDIYFAGIKPIAKLNHWRWNIQNRIISPSGAEQRYLHLGCGPKYTPGFLNIEGWLLYKKDLWLDLRNGLPFSPETVDGIYTCHVFEHFYYSELETILRECHRVLKPDSGIRILVPSMLPALQAYFANDLSWFADFPRPLSSKGGKLFNFLLCDGQHRIVFDYSLMEELLSSIGFSTIMEKTPRQSSLFQSDRLSSLEPVGSDYIEKSLIVEARKSPSALGYTTNTAP